MLTFIKSSVSSTNIEAAKGGGAGDSIEDVRLNAISSFSTQNRTVTKNDYIIRSLSMPPQFGAITKAYITQDDQMSPLTTEPNRIPNPLALNLYTLGYDSNKKLSTLNTATKTNLATYLEEHRMLTDAINIKDAFIINIDKWQINQPIILSDVRNLIGGVNGVQTVENITFSNKNGTISGYSQYIYPIQAALRNEVLYPSLDPSIFEIKYPDTDIKGRVTTY